MGKLTDYQKIEIVKKYLTGDYTCVYLAKEYGVVSSSIRMILLRRNIKINNNQSELQRKYTLNQHYFDIINTEEKAYFLGLLYADGCNMENRNSIKICLQEQDKEILDKFNKALESNNSLKFIKKTKESHQNQYSLEVVNKHMSKKLAELGCVQAKSLILKFPTEEQVPNYLIRHFIRGYFDGDGSISFYKDERKCNSYRLTINIVGTKYFLEKQYEIIKKELNINCCFRARFPERNNSTTGLYISGGKQCRKFMNWLYEDATIWINRKWNKFKEAKDYFNSKGIYDNNCRDRT